MTHAALGTLLGATGCWDAHTIGADADLDAQGAPDASATASSLVWALVHPTNAPEGPGIVLFDEATQTVIRRLPLPEPTLSVHGLAYDGDTLWVSSLGRTVGPFSDGVALFALDAGDGHALRRFERIAAQGLAVDAGTLWYAGARPDEAGPSLVHITYDDEQLSVVPIPETWLIEDLTLANGALYYLANDDLDRIMRIDPRTGDAVELARGVYEAPYALGFDGRYLAVPTNDGRNRDPRIRRFDPATGALVSEGPFRVGGWVTAIAFVR